MIVTEETIAWAERMGACPTAVKWLLEERRTVTDIVRHDHSWALWALVRLNLRGCVLFAAQCAADALPVYESSHSDDLRPRAAIQAALDFADGKVAAIHPAEEKLYADSADVVAGLSVGPKRDAAMSAAMALRLAGCAARAVTYCTDAQDHAIRIVGCMSWLTVKYSASALSGGGAKEEATAIEDVQRKRLVDALTLAINKNNGAV